MDRRIQRQVWSLFVATKNRHLIVARVRVHKHRRGDADEGEFEGALGKVSIAFLRAREFLLRFQPGEATRFHDVVAGGSAEEETHERVLEQLGGIWEVEALKH